MADRSTKALGPKVLAAVTRDRFVGVDVIAVAADVGRSTARRWLDRFVADGLVQMEYVSLNDGGYAKQLYKRLDDGEIAPLFVTGNHDTSALAICWGGYTYKETKKQPKSQRVEETAAPFVAGSHDASALALCWGGYTHNGAKRHGVSQ